MQLAGMSTNLSDFPSNLRLLSSHHRSVTDLCRRIGFNRQQFNKYLAGTYLPTARNLRRLADFFGVEESELFLPNDQFTRNVLAKPQSTDLPIGVNAFWRDNLAETRAAQVRLAPYCGYYHLHFRSPAWPNRIIRSLSVISQVGDATYIRNVERLVRKDNSSLGSFVCKYSGLVFLKDDRIYCLDRPDNPGNGFSSMIFYTNQRRKLILIHGLLLSVTAGSGRQIYSSRAVMNYLGGSSNVREALRQCGIYPANHQDFDAEIRDAVTNDVDARSGSMLALEI